MRQRINMSLTDEGLAILDHERDRMGLSRSAFMEVVLRFWVRDQSALAQSVDDLLSEVRAKGFREAGVADPLESI